MHVDRRAEVVRDALAAAVEPRALGVPRLLKTASIARSSCWSRVLRELLARLLEDDRL
jgi:hypothetical protein